MIRRATEEDIPLLNRIFGDDSVWYWISDDGTPGELRNSLGSFLMTLQSTFILTDGEIAAFVFHVHSSVMYEVHISILPSGRGEQGISLGREALEWIFSNTSCRKLIGWISETNRPALFYAASLGFHKEGLVTKSFLKNGTLIDQHILSKEKS